MHSRDRLLSWIGLMSLLLAAHVVLAGPASADTSGVDNAFVPPGQQRGVWSRADRRVRLGSYPNVSMGTDRCMDSMLDWETSGGHYDARVVRSCLPGGDATTDPGGDGYWSEPSNWGGANITDMQKGMGAKIDDDYVGGNFVM